MIGMARKIFPKISFETENTRWPLNYGGKYLYDNCNLYASSPNLEITARSNF